MQTNSGFVTRAIALLLIALCPLLAPGQSPSDKLPTVTTGGNLNPGAVSDINAQLIWLLAASPSPKDSHDVWKVRSTYRYRAFGHAIEDVRLFTSLSKFRSRHDEIAAEYNALIRSVAREDVWVEYRNFRVKINDLVAETVRNLYNTFPESSSSFRAAIERCKRDISLSTYRSSSDSGYYATGSRSEATGFAYIQGVVSTGPLHEEGHGDVEYVTAVVTGMVPGCPGLVSPNVRIGGEGAAWIEGPKQRPLEYMDYQVTRPVGADREYLIAVSCEIAKAK